MLSISSGARPMSRKVPLGEGLSLKVRYALKYSSVVSRIIGELKYGDKPGVAGLLGRYLDLALAGPDAASGNPGVACPGSDAGLPIHDVARPSPAVVSVPMRSAKKRERGYNQSELLARCLAKRRGLELRVGLLSKQRSTVSQTTLEYEARTQNVRGAFGLSRRTGLGSSRSSPVDSVLLVDDVVTTGATLRECALVLLESGVKEISACAVASS
jgi:ComF family protein